MLPRSWSKSFDSGIVTPRKKRFCNKSKVERMCDKCNIQINENKEFEANLNELKGHRPIEFSHMLPF